MRWLGTREAENVGYGELESVDCAIVVKARKLNLLVGGPRDCVRRKWIGCRRRREAQIDHRRFGGARKELHELGLVFSRQLRSERRNNIGVNLRWYHAWSRGEVVIGINFDQLQRWFAVLRVAELECAG